jgi:hypothetical protein
MVDGSCCKYRDNRFLRLSISTMLKYLFLSSTAIVYFAIVATTPIQIASAASISASSSADKLIVKDEKVKITQVNASQSDLNGIRQTLTQFYRGFNERSVARIAKVAPLSGRDKHQIEALFTQINSVGGDWSIEVRNIELVSFSDRNAFMRIEEIHKISVRGQVKTVPQSTSIRLSKHNGRWQVSDLSSALSSLDRR